MKVNMEVVNNVATLARLKLDEGQAEALAQSMEKILDMVEEMQAVDTAGVIPLSHPLDSVQPLRPDDVEDFIDRDRWQTLAPETEAGFYLVPRVVE
ncbi:MAG: Asp-tRNA(Asn)/Glu-tRNA(Gln) amidotransferase subunit GatC [Pseudomonadota bacterium]